jgi:NIMA (never in mitosis gene a)-related kinase
LNIIHRDIKPENILIVKDDQVKMMDFSLSKQIESISNCVQNLIGICVYMSPEMINKESYNINTDIWSLGCIIFELMSLNHPFSDDITKYMDLIIQQAIPKYNNIHHSIELIKLVQQMICYNSFERISLSELETSAYFLKFNKNL